MTQTSMFDYLIVDNFAGGGGASCGIELATGRPVDIAINHDPDAIAMHKANHPYTEHYKNIGECLLLFFSTPPFERPIRPHKYHEYVDILAEWKRNREK